jgi:predicted metal-binding membrane protein
MGAVADRRIAGGLLVLAGLYQLMPLKQNCLALCRSPVAFLTQHYRKGSAGAVRMGLSHGLYCLGCCWAAMALLFVGGVMNPVWIAGLAIFVLVEKALPFGRIAGLVLGAAGLIAGLVLILASSGG